MEYIILGLLLFKPMTAYEISAFINKNLALICSGSAGSVQIALKKLLKNGSITLEEFVENSINKKLYSITKTGSSHFQNWINTPMQSNKVKNMELSKLFFLGFADKEKQIAATKDYINQLLEVKKTLLAIKELTFNANYEKLEQLPFTNTEDIANYQKATLDFGIDSAEFQINWYQNLLSKML